MSAQINLYHPRFLKVHDWLNLNNLAMATLAMFSLLGLMAFLAQQQLSRQQAELTAVSNELMSVNQALEEANQLATQPVAPQLLAEVSHAQATLARREEILHLLESGAMGSHDGFSAYLQGIARQIPSGLWLTGLSIDAGGNAIEIRGSALDEKIVPDYIRRLGSEKVFQGRQFSALSLQRDAKDAGADPAKTAQTTPQDDAATVSPAPTFAGSAAQAMAATTVRRPIHFVLTPNSVSLETKP